MGAVIDRGPSRATRIAETQSTRTAGETGQPAAERVADSLRTGIFNGRYAPGQRLVEAEITAAFSVSRSTARAAFAQLEGEGLVESIPGRGSSVRRLSRQGVWDLFEVRGTLDGLGARLAAARIELDENRLRLESAAAVWDREDVASTATTHMDENAAFHGLILEIAGNARLVQSVRQMQVPGFRVRFHALLDHAGLARSVADHKAIARAILEGRARRAEALARQHARRAAELIQTLSDDEFWP
ncbi:MAG: GntR family transcriptional regulator [Betaproteobacteria bacterium]|nr:GntR family transcriptional regulator [Betaproteobacteria bacterium]